MKKITILIPCYNEESALSPLYGAIHELMNAFINYQWEMLFVNDGSTDSTIDILRNLREADRRVCYIDLSRNFGKENAMLAGFDYTQGDCTIIMDADLQHPPCVIPEMIRKWEEGYEDVYGRRMSRGKESWLRKVMTMSFYRLLQKSTRYDILPNVGDFRLLDRKCVDELKKLRENERYTKGMYAWIGFRKTSVSFETQDRVAGESHMSYRSLIRLAVEGITSFTVAPLKWSIAIGILVSMGAFVYMCFILIKALFFGDPVAGFPTLMVVILFLGGIQLFSIGLLGEYLGKVFIETKNRPVYVVREIAANDNYDEEVR